MRIKGTTSSYCKITDIKISGFKAYVYLLVTSTTPQIDPISSTANTCVFSFFARDLDTSLTRLTNNNYWIDRCNNYDNNLNNVDINKHKQIILEIDITNKNNSIMRNNRWVRELQIVMINTRTNEEAWTSDYIELISKEVSLPEINAVKLIKTKSELQLSFNLNYATQEDFNYINDNLKPKVLVTSAYTNTLLESYDVPMSSLSNLNPNKQVNITLNKYYTEPFLIKIRIENLRGDVLKEKENFYNPELIFSNISAIKNNKPIVCKRMVAITKDGCKNIINIK